MSATLRPSAIDNNDDPFAHRADDYAAANIDLPDARRTERDKLLDALPLAGLRRVIDLQAASGYVGDGLLSRTDGRLWIASIEPSRELVRRIPARLGPVHAALHDLPFASRSIDAVTCLAGTHHSDQLADIIRDTFRVLAPGGYISIAEVEVDTGPARWLNDFVDRWSPDGHSGRFVKPGELSKRMHESGFVDVTESAEEVPWRFGNRAELLSFCRTLFGLRAAPGEQMAEALDSSVGILEQGGNVTLQWRLRYAAGRRRPSI